MRNLTKSGKHSKIQHCCECKERIEPIWKDLPNEAETWEWLECEDCGDYICGECECSILGEEDIKYCPTCYQGKIINKGDQK